MTFMAKMEQTKTGTPWHRKVKNKKPSDEEDKAKALWRAGSEYDFRELGQVRAVGDRSRGIISFVFVS